MDEEDALPSFLVKSTVFNTNSAPKTPRDKTVRRIVKSERFERDPLDALGKDLALHILSFFKVSDLLKISRVCKLWYSLCTDDTIWFQRFHLLTNQPMKSAKPQERRGKGTKKKATNTEKPHFWLHRYRNHLMKTRYEKREQERLILEKTLRPHLNSHFNACKHYTIKYQITIIAHMPNAQQIYCKCTDCSATFNGYFTRDLPPILFDKI